MKFNKHPNYNNVAGGTRALNATR